ncbi:MAG TPA: arylesterase [Stellaceae bacterium]|nr:arylesterase [Stellaceae bacterium]
MTHFLSPRLLSPRLSPLWRIALLALLMMAPAAGADTRPRLIALGDSLTAGYGLATKDSFPAQLQARLKAQGVEVEIINSGVSGDTSAGGLARLQWVLSGHPDEVLLELGANDALRGIDPALTEANLDQILTRLEEAKIRVMLLGMRSPGNWGPEFQAAFDAIYPRLAQKHGVPLYPFFLEGVARKADLNQPDGLHPNEKGVAAIVDRLAPLVADFLEAKGAHQ